MTKRSKSSHRWLERQRQDPFTRKAAREGRVSRAYYKFEALDRRFRLVRSGSRIIELGAAPGGWTGYLAERAGSGRVIACDRLPMTVPSGVVFIHGDVEEQATIGALEQVLEGAGADLVLSDMAPNMSGSKVRDQAAAMELVEVALQTAGSWLNPGGHLVVKMFQGDGFEEVLARLRAEFERVNMVKPPASRNASREFYAVAQTRKHSPGDAESAFAGDADVE